MTPLILTDMLLRPDRPRLSLAPLFVCETDHVASARNPVGWLSLTTPMCRYSGSDSIALKSREKNEGMAEGQTYIYQSFAMGRRSR